LRDYGQNADARIHFEGCGNLRKADGNENQVGGEELV
jgi:hypothetical protein